MRLRILKEASIKKGARVIVRADFDVSLNNGKIVDDFRIRRAIPTLKFILKRGGLLRIISHVGRPRGRKRKGLEMRNIARRLGGILKRKIIFITDPLSQKRFAEYNGGREILFFENIRFWRAEEKNDFNFAKKLSRWGDLYVNEAFAASHRTHASTVSIPRNLPSFVGLNFAKEIHYLSALTKKPLKPMVAILGGAKLETKMPLINHFLQSANRVLLGGALANEAFYLKGMGVGTSPLGEIIGKKRILKALNSKKLYLPVDVVVSGSRRKSFRTAVKSADKVGPKDFIVDLGPSSISAFIDLCRGTKTIVWNGPLGLIEVRRFARGTADFARGLSKIRALKIVGGGDTLMALRKNKLLGGFTFVSTGGGAMLDFLAGKKLPGIEVLKRQATSDKRHG